MSVPAGFKGLRFPCECVSSRPGSYSDPWAEIAKKKLLPNGTKEEILNVLAQGPNTITQIAEVLGLSAPSVHTHVRDMLGSELLREAVEWEKTHPAERYYEPNFPVFKAEECAEFRALCEEMSKELVTLFEKKQSRSNVLLLKLVFPKRAGRLRTSRSVCSRICIAAPALCWSSAGCYRPARNTQTALSGSSG